MEPATSSEIKSFIPNVADEKCPKLGMLFSTIDEAFDFYNTYAKDAGFSVRKSSEKKRIDATTKEKNIYWKRFVCSKEGHSVEKSVFNTDYERRVMETRENCSAEFQVKKKRGESNYSVCKFVKEHTHMLSTPHKRHLLRSHRIITPAQKNLIDTYQSANVKTANAMAVFELQANGFENIGFTETDLRNHNRDKRMKKIDNDGQLVYEYLLNCKERDDRFIFSIERDSEKQITHIFWAEHLFQQSYRVFGDVVSFDTTYMTNKYGLIFGAFTGINHHGGSVLFGCGFMSNEKFETFVWLFKKWLEIMPAGPPKAFITDQDPAMTKAIQYVMPTTSHRFCIWHIMEKFPVKLAGIAINFEHFLKDMKDCIYNSVTKEQFQVTWNILLERYKLTEHIWLNDMYEIREMWVPIFCRGVFFGGMISSQRSESMNSFVKCYVTRKNTLFEFFTNLERGISRQKQQELIEQHQTLDGRPKLKSKMPMEKQISEIYTRKKFYEFQEQVMSMVTSSARCVGETNGESSYIVSDIENGIETERMVQLKGDPTFANCSCQMFEFEGIPCSHVLSVLRQEKVYTLPFGFILKRWSRNARVVPDENEAIINVQSTSGDTLVGRHSELSYSVTLLVDEGCMSRKAYEHARRGILQLKRECRQINESEAIGENEAIREMEAIREKDHMGEGSNTIQYYPPAHANTKGRSKRIKSSKEKAQKKDRLCRGCNRRGVSHDRRNCPVLLKRCTTQVHGKEDNIDSDSYDGASLDMFTSDEER